MSEENTSAQARRVVIGVDTGGTFTDVTLLDPRTGRIWNAKTPSSPDDPSRGFGEGIVEVLKKAGIEGAEVNRVLHGTTVATNLILESKGPQTAMLVNEGFRYVLEIGRQDVPRGKYLLSWRKPRRPVQPRHIFEVPGRINADGSELEPLDEARVREAARKIRDADLKSVSIVFLNSYANGAHERRAAQILGEEMPGVRISLSSEVMPVFREYERTMTTNLNAYVMQAVSTYVARLEARVKALGVEAPLLLMKSSGGVAGAKAIHKRPVETALSGPAAGIVGAKLIAQSAGFKDLICIDIGGTSADVSLIHNGELGLTSRGRIGDWPIGLPMVDVVTIGAGGGSIARVSAEGQVTVGPESAGARPGPVCYGRGGTQPCVTDAHLVLGHLPPFLLNGSFTLDVQGAREAVDRHVASKLGISIEDAARGILAIADNNMVVAIRLVSVEKGYDPREFVLVPFGGAGPLHAGAIARQLGIRKILIPPAPGVLSALGLLASDLRAEFSRTVLQRSGSLDAERLVADLRGLEERAQQWFEEEQVPKDQRALRRVALMRYQHQGFELPVDLGDLGQPQAGFEAAVQAFHAEHQRLYSFSQPDTPVELTNLRVDAIGMLPKPQLPRVTATGSAADARIGTVAMALPEGTIQAPVYDRDKLAAGASVDGPCVLSQLDSTAVLLRGQRAVVHEYGSLIVTEA